jgi:hypothetical protein
MGLKACVFPWNLIGHLLSVTFIRRLVAPVYAWVARHRHQFLPQLPQPYPPPKTECPLPDRRDDKAPPFNE